MELGWSLESMEEGRKKKGSRRSKLLKEENLSWKLSVHRSSGGGSESDGWMMDAHR